MKAALSLIIHGVILWAASCLFPDIVQIDSTATLILATILIWLISFVIGIICLLIIGVGAIFDSPVWLIIGIVVLFVMIVFADVIGMTIIGDYLDGFMVVGFWPKVLLSICFSIFSTGGVEFKQARSDF